MYSDSSVPNVQHQLEAAWYTPIWIAGAEIIRYYHNGASGWKQTDIERFEGMMATMAYYAKKRIREPQYHNQAASAAFAVMAVGVFNNDDHLYDQGVEEWKRLMPIAISPLGIVKEFARDCRHPDYTLRALSLAAEVGYHQGDDLYGYMPSISYVPSIGGRVPLLLDALEYASELWYAPENKPGIPGYGNSCCNDSCGRCGGSGCSGLPGGSSSCCTSKVSSSGRSCWDNMPPCSLELTTDEYTDPNQSTFLGVLPICKDPVCGKSSYHKDGYERAYNHYAYRKGLTVEGLKELTEGKRDDGTVDGHFPSWDTLTHGDLDK
jgi:hypothetical protein